MASLEDVANLVEALTRFAVSTVHCGRFSLSTHAVLEPGSLVPACAAASAPRAVSMSATCMPCTALAAPLWHNMSTLILTL